MDSKKLQLLKDDMAKHTKSKYNVDSEAVQNIVNKMRKKKTQEGSSGDMAESHLKELRSIIAEGKLSKMNIDSNTKLIQNENSSYQKSSVKIYKKFSKIINKLVLFILKNPIGKKISFYLTSANSKKTLLQHIIFSIISSALVCGFVSVLISIILAYFNLVYIVLLPVLFIVLFIILFYILVYIVPMKKAKTRGIMIDTELPYALRHLATELQAGIGLYKVIQSIAKNDYGVLSDEMNRVVLEIENGIDTKTALRHASLRSQSKNFNIAMFHIVRTMNTGGNLARTINGVADTVSFDLMESAKQFGEKMNFFGIIFIFIAIVLPVFAAILGSIANTPLGQGGELFMPGVMTPTTLTLIFVVVLPIIFILLIYYIKMIAPKM
jgi:flagellar protein FlaJ